MGDAADDLIDRMSDPDMPFWASRRYRIGNSLHRAAERHNDFEGSVWDVDKINKAERLERQARRLREQAEAEETRRAVFGDEPELGTVFRFEKQYDTNEAPFSSYRNSYTPVKYLYAATRTKIGWVLSAREETDPMTYEELIDFIGDSPCEVARKWKTVQ